jgi:hypothetical protein
MIFIGGPKGAGKDTAAKALLNLNPPDGDRFFVQANFADSVKAICAIKFGLTHAEMNDPSLKEVMLDRWPYKCPRELLQSEANTSRTLYAADIWVRAWERNVKQIKDIATVCLISTDLRHPEEIERIHELNGLIFYIYNPEVEEMRREARKNKDPLWSDSSEAFSELVLKSADEVIQNDGKDFVALSKSMVNAFTKHFSTWTRLLELGLSPAQYPPTEKGA